jgi:hypothetical protein
VAIFTLWLSLLKQTVLRSNSPDEFLAVIAAVTVSFSVSFTAKQKWRQRILEEIRVRETAWCVEQDVTGTSCGRLAMRVSIRGDFLTGRSLRRSKRTLIRTSRPSVCLRPRISDKTV